MKAASCFTLVNIMYVNNSSSIPVFNQNKVYKVLIVGYDNKFKAEWCDESQTESQQGRKFNEISQVDGCISKEGRKNRKSNDEKRVDQIVA